MKKKLLLIIVLFILFIGTSNVYAGSLSINGKTSVYVNSTVGVTVNFNNIAGKFSITSSNQNVLGGVYEDFYDNQTVTLNFSAKSSGISVITVTPIGKVGDYDIDEYTGGSRSITINVITKTNNSTVDVNKTYSKNNYLKSLGIDGYTLTPEFNKDVLEYTVTLEPGTEKININTEVEDKKASVRGSGEVSVSEGINTLEVVVTAENGNEKAYKVVATINEKDPIKVNIDKKEYTVVKKKELIVVKEGYEESTVNIKGFEIPSLYNKVTKVTLVGLKDSEGNIKLFSYNSGNGEYKIYLELKFDLMNLYIHEKKNSIYKKINFKINDVDVIGYQLKNINDYYLLYATNTLTGNESYYLYDKKENSVQRYDTTMLDKLNEEKDKYLALVIVLSCVCFLSMLFLLIEVNRDNKRKNEV